jgi:hypothetical protein
MITAVFREEEKNSLSLLLGFCYVQDFFKMQTFVHGKMKPLHRRQVYLHSAQ